MAKCRDRRVSDNEVAKLPLKEKVSWSAKRAMLSLLSNWLRSYSLEVLAVSLPSETARRTRRPGRVASPTEMRAIASQRCNWFAQAEWVFVPWSLGEARTAVTPRWRLAALAGRSSKERMRVQSRAKMETWSSG